MNQNNTDFNRINCDICKTETEQNTHYCVNCGNNLSNKIELTDVLFFLSYFLNGFIMVIVLPFLVLSKLLRFWDSFFGLKIDYTVLVTIALILVIIPKIINKIAIILCKKNLENLEVSNGKNQ